MTAEDKDEEKTLQSGQVRVRFGSFRLPPQLLASNALTAMHCTEPSLCSCNPSIAWPCPASHHNAIPCLPSPFRLSCFRTQAASVKEVQQAVGALLGPAVDFLSDVRILFSRLCLLFLSLCATLLPRRFALACLLSGACCLAPCLLWPCGHC